MCSSPRPCVSAAHASDGVSQLVHALLGQDILVRGSFNWHTRAFGRSPGSTHTVNRWVIERRCALSTSLGWSSYWLDARPTARLNNSRVVCMPAFSRWLQRCVRACMRRTRQNNPFWSKLGRATPWCVTRRFALTAAREAHRGANLLQGCERRHILQLVTQRLPAAGMSGYRAEDMVKPSGLACC